MDTLDEPVDSCNCLRRDIGSGETFYAHALSCPRYLAPEKTAVVHYALISVPMKWCAFHLNPDWECVQSYGNSRDCDFRPLFYVQKP